MPNTTDIAKRFRILNPGRLDSWYGPYLSTSDAMAKVPQALRIGRVVGINTESGIVDYWWKNGINIFSLIPYIVPGSPFKFQNAYNADSNVPVLSDSIGEDGYVYYVNVAGSQDLGSGLLVMSVGDELIYGGGKWNLVKNVKSIQTPSSILNNAVLSGDGSKVLNIYDQYTGVPFNGDIIEELPSTVSVDDMLFFSNPDKFGGGYLERAFDVNSISARVFGCRCDGVTDDSENFQLAIDICTKMGYILNVYGLKIKLNNTIVTNGNLRIVGSSRGTLLDFSSIAAGEDLLVVCDTVFVNQFNIDGARIIGNQNSGAAIRCNRLGTIAIALTDSSFSNLRVENCGLGLKMVYSFCNIFYNVRFQNCAKCFELGSQANNNEFIRCGFVTHYLTNTLTNCEGTNFTSCNHANCTARSHINLFQSNISLINPYQENIANNFITVGSSNQVIPSSLTIIGGKCTDPKLMIQLGGDRCSIVVKNPSPNARVIVYDGTANLAPSKYTTRLEIDSAQTKSDNFLVKWDALTDIPFVADSGGSNNVRNINSMTTSLVKNDTASFNGITLASNLVIGEPYILIYSIKKTLVSDTVSLKHGSIASQILKVNEPNDDFETRKEPFVAKHTKLSIVWNAGESLNFNFVGLTKNESPCDIIKGSVMYYHAIPTVGSYRRGDTIMQSNPSGGVVSEWRCAASGTPGTWRPSGQIGEDSGTTLQRPVVSKVNYQYYDLTLNKPIWWNGSTWRDASGTIV